MKASDYMRLYVTGSLADAGRWTELYSAEAHVREAQRRIDPRLSMAGLHPNYGPTAALLLAPLSRLPFLKSWALFSILSVAAFLIGTSLLVTQTSELSTQRRLVLLLCVASPALFETLRYGQLSAITTALFLGAATLDRRGWPVAAGVCLGLAAYKPNLVLPAAVVWLIAREWRLLAGLIFGVLLHLTLGLLAAKVEVTLSWLTTLLALARDPSLVQGFPHEVHSLRGFWRLTGLDVSALGWLTAASSIIVLGLTVWIWRRTTDRNPRWAAVVLGTLLVSPHLLTYDLLLLTVPLLLVADTALRTKPRAVWWKLLLISLYFGPLVSPLLARLSGVQVSTVAMAWLLGLLGVQLAAGRAGAKLVRAGVPRPGYTDDCGAAGLSAPDRSCCSSRPIISSYAARPTTIQSMSPRCDQKSHIPPLIRSALVNAQGSIGYAGCQTLESAPPSVKNPCDFIPMALDRLTQW